MKKQPSIAQRAVNSIWSAIHGKPVPTSTTRRIHPGTPKRRAFAAAEVDNTTRNFLGTTLSINEELRRSLPRMRSRSRQLAQDNDYVKRFLKMVQSNVIGPTGINLQCEFLDNNGRTDEADCQLVEGHWNKWAKKRECSIDGRLSWRDIQSLAITTIARDGEVLIQKIRSRGNRYGIKLRVLECDHLDIEHNDIARNGNRIVMGVEIDRNDAPVAYWLSDHHPGASHYQATRIKRRRVPARDILHIFITERPGQLRGVPWLHTAIRRLNMLGGYEEAELIAARLGASKMGAYITPDGSGPTPTDLSPDAPDDDDGSDHDLVEEVEPGLIQTLPEGWHFESFDPQHPNSGYADFTKQALRGVSSGLNVSYHSLGNDLEGVNLSSIRAGTLEERDMWRVLQCWLGEQLHDEVYLYEWLPWQVDFGALTMLPPDKIESKFSTITWWPRGWHWIDPLKDTRANAEEYELGTTSLTEIARQRGKDIRKVFKDRRAELDLAATYNLTVGVTKGRIEITNAENDDGEEDQNQPAKG